MARVADHPNSSDPDPTRKLDPDTTVKTGSDITQFTLMFYLSIKNVEKMYFRNYNFIITLVTKILHNKCNFRVIDPRLKPDPILKKKQIRIQIGCSSKSESGSVTVVLSVQKVVTHFI